jgi:hypothetical protein
MEDLNLTNRPLRSFSPSNEYNLKHALRIMETEARTE